MNTQSQDSHFDEYAAVRQKLEEMIHDLKGYNLHSHEFNDLEKRIDLEGNEIKRLLVQGFLKTSS